MCNSNYPYLAGQQTMQGSPIKARGVRGSNAQPGPGGYSVRSADTDGEPRTPTGKVAGRRDSGQGVRLLRRALGD